MRIEDILLVIALALFFVACYCIKGECIDKVVETIAYEASDQPFEGQIMVGHVILNRSKAWNKTIEQVIFMPKHFKCWRDRKPMQSRELTRRELYNADCAYNMAQAQQRDDILYYMRYDEPRPEWLVKGLLSGRIVKYKRIGDHVFYRDLEVR